MSTEYAVVKRGSKFLVFPTDDPRSEQGIVFPEADGMTSYQRARKYADSCQEDLAQVRRAIRRGR